MTTLQTLMSLLPARDGTSPDWRDIAALWPEIAALDACPQSPVHHAEGDVGTHTRMVLDALVRDPDWQALPMERASRLFWATILHDVGKPATTRHEADGRITSRGHSGVGARIARRLLWEVGAPFAWREEICNLISCHQSPFWLYEREDPSRMAAEMSWICDTRDLCLHATADARGRRCADALELFDGIALARLIFQEIGAWGTPFPFANDESRVAALSRSDRDLHHAAHEEFSCTATLMCGLPGAGKDTWLAAHGGDLEVISLDDMRRAAGISHADNQGRIIQAAREAARVHLRAGRDFAWNATNLTRQSRAMLTGLFRDYGARIRIVYVEVAPKVLRSQNETRDAVVPREAMSRAIDRLEVPTRIEAHEVLPVIDGGAA